MKIQFNKASQTDGTLVTLNLTQFDKASQTDGTLVTLNLTQFDEASYSLCLDRSSLKKKDSLILTIDENEVIFKVNRVRSGKAITATTHCFPRYLRLPQVGKPVIAEVSYIY